jgi:hypothetical protein
MKAEDDQPQISLTRIITQAFAESLICALAKQSLSKIFVSVMLVQISGEKFRVFCVFSG